MYKISFCDENREKRNASAGSGNTKSLRGAVINQTGTHFYIYSALCAQAYASKEDDMQSECRADADLYEP